MTISSTVVAGRPAVSSKIKGWIDRLGTVWVEGEITQWGVSGGNVYGKLKDLDRGRHRELHRLVVGARQASG